MVNSYYDPAYVRNVSEKHSHRAAIGGLWDELGDLQFNYLKSKGLDPEMRLLDLGCGCLRGGVKYAEFLNPGNYFGIDLSQELLDAGYNIELIKSGIQHRVPQTNLMQSAHFEAQRFGIEFDKVVAVSLFSHLPINHMRFCLSQISKSVKLGGRFYSSCFVLPDNVPWEEPYHHSVGTVITHPAQDPYHYIKSDIEYVYSDTGWKLIAIEDWNHPRSQMMTIFERV